MKPYQYNNEKNTKLDNNTNTNFGLGISTLDNNNFGLGNNANFGLGISTSDELLTSSKGFNSNLSKSKQVNLNLKF